MGQDLDATGVGDVEFGLKGVPSGEPELAELPSGCGRNATGSLAITVRRFFSMKNDFTRKNFLMREKWGADAAVVGDLPKQTRPARRCAKGLARSLPCRRWS